MQTPRLFLVLSGLLASTSALAASGGTPITLSTTGYLLGAQDTPFAGPADLRFRVTTAASGGSVEWEGTCAAVPVQQGYYAVVLGSAACAGSSAGGLDPSLDTSDLPANAARWLEVAVDGTTLSPRLLVASVPTAARALDAEALGGKAPGWYAPATHTHAAADVTGFAAAAVDAVTASGQFAQAGTLTAGKWCTSDGTGIQCTSDAPSGGGGTNSGQATAGATSPIACGPTTAGYLHYDPSGPSLKVCNGASYVTFVAVTPPPVAPTGVAATAGNTTMSVTWSAVAAAESYEVGIQAGSVITSEATIVSTASTSRSFTGLTNSQLYTVAVRSVAGQWRSAWSTTAQATPMPYPTVVLTGGARRWSDGTVAANCRGYLTPPANYMYSGDTGDGAYTVDPDGAGSIAAFNTYCDMSTDGGGWTLVFKYNAPNDSTVAHSVTGAQNAPGTNLLDANVTTGSKLADNVINALRSTTGTGIAYRVTSPNLTQRYYFPGACTYQHVANSQSECLRYTATWSTATSPTYVQCMNWGGNGGGLNAWYGCGSSGTTYTNVANTHRGYADSAGMTSNAAGTPLGGSNTTYSNKMLMWVR